MELTERIVQHAERYRLGPEIIVDMSILKTMLTSAEFSSKDVPMGSAIINGYTFHGVEDLGGICFSSRNYPFGGVVLTVDQHELAMKAINSAINTAKYIYVGNTFFINQKTGQRYIIKDNSLELNG